MASNPGQSPQHFPQFPKQPISIEIDICPKQPISSENDICTPTPQPSEDSLLKVLRKELFKAAMSSDWKKLLELYKNSEQAQNEKITRAEDTVLHVAMSRAPEYTVLKLLDIVDKNNIPEEKNHILGSQNKNGDTPLHLAASLGLEAVCWKISGLCPVLVTFARNNLQETPLFTAVRHGKKKTFFVLEAAIHKEQGLKSYDDCLSRDITHCRRYDGSNILHIAIKGEHFGLAYEIIHLYPELMNRVNPIGETPLHTLANMPSVFPSGTQLGIFDTIIYHCMITDPPKLEFNFQEKQKYELQKVTLKDKKELLPVSYNTCVDLYSLLKDLMSIIFHTVASCLRTGILMGTILCDYEENQDEENQAEGRKEVESRSSENQEERRKIPPNYDAAFFFVKNVIKFLQVVLGKGLRRVQTIQEYKKKHRRALKIMKKLVDDSTLWEYDEYTRGGGQPQKSQIPLEFRSLPPPTIPMEEDTDLEGKDASRSKAIGIQTAVVEDGRDILEKILRTLEAKNVDKKDTVVLMNVPDMSSPVLVAAKSGITEMVKRILQKFPVAILDQDKDEKNIVLLAAEHRQVHVYKFMLGCPTMQEHVFGKFDNKGNSALHLAVAVNHPPTNTGVALQMQRGIKWYKYVANSVHENVRTTTNNEGKTAEKVFTMTYESQFKESREWLNYAASSFSVVSTLIVTVAYMASSTVPGGFNNNSGFPIFQNNPDFQVFTLASLIALCFAVAALITFLGIIIRPYNIWDFEKNIPLQLIFGFSCSIISIGSMLVSFCAGHSFTIDGQLRSSAYVLYALLCVPVFLSLKWLSNLYTSLLETTFSTVPSFR